jgi:hypothetical protein
MKISALIGAIVMFVFCFLLKKFLHVFALPGIIICGTIGFILLMVGLFSSSFTNVQQKEKEEEKKE